jgi:hypothetical protein
LNLPLYHTYVRIISRALDNRTPLSGSCKDLNVQVVHRDTTLPITTSPLDTPETHRMDLIPLAIPPHHHFIPSTRLAIYARNHVQRLERSVSSDRAAIPKYQPMRSRSSSTNDAAIFAQGDYDTEKFLSRRMRVSKDDLVML